MQTSGQSVDISDIQITSQVCTRALHEFLCWMETPTKQLCIDLWHDANKFRKERASFA